MLLYYYCYYFFTILPDALISTEFESFVHKTTSKISTILCVCVCEKYTVCLFLTTCRLVRETSQHLALGRQSRRGRGLGADIFLAQNDTRLWPSPPHSPVGGRGKTSFANCVNDEFNLCLTESGKGRESS